MRNDTRVDPRDFPHAQVPGVPQYWLYQLAFSFPRCRLLRYVQFHNSSRAAMLCLDREAWLRVSFVDHGGTRGLRYMGPAVMLRLPGREFFFELCSGYVSVVDVERRHHSFGRTIVDSLKNLEARQDSFMWT